MKETHTWAVQYFDKSYDKENGFKKWHELNFDNIDRFILIPKNKNGTFLSIKKPKNSIIIFRKKRQQRYSINIGFIKELPILYYVGIENGDSLLFKNVENGLEDSSKIICKDGFRCLFDGTYLINNIGIHRRSNFMINNKYKYILLEKLI